MTLDMAGTVRSRWGEGPLWWQGCLYYVDIESHLVHRLDPTNGQEDQWNVGERVGAVVPRQRGGLVVASERGFHFLDPESGALSAIGDPEPGKEENRMNDGKCSPDGRFFAGTISMVRKEGDASLYRLDPDLSIRKIFGGVTNSNGIGWSPDESTVFYIDTPRRAVQAFDYDRTNGTLTRGRIAFETTSTVDASPDGMAIDSEGHLWIAFCHGSCVVCFDQTGKVLHRIDLPCREVTAPAFGGENLDELYITTGIPKEEVEEDAGRLFVVRGLGVRGMAAYPFAG